jgi:Spy/CpxP family protein refolding chaperone
MINKILALILVFSLAFNIAFVGIWAYTRTGGRVPWQHRRRPQGWRDGWRRLGLSEGQKRELQRRRARLREDMRSARETLERQRQRLFDLLEQEDIDEEAVRRTRESIEQTQERIRHMTFEHMRGLREVLTPEQHRAMMQMMKRHSGGGGMHGRERMRGPGHRRPGMRDHMRGPEAPRADGPAR